MLTAVHAKMSECNAVANARVVDLCCGMGGLSVAAREMGMNAVPRSVATGLGENFAAAATENTDLHSVRSGRAYLRTLSPTDWQRSARSNAKMSGEDYRDIWALLAGEHLERRGGA